MIGARSLRARLLISLLFALWFGAGPLLLFVDSLKEEGLTGLKPWEWGLSISTMQELVTESIVRTADGELRSCSDATTERRTETYAKPNLRRIFRGLSNSSARLFSRDCGGARRDEHLDAGFSRVFHGSAREGRLLLGLAQNAVRAQDHSGLRLSVRLALDFQMAR